MAAAPLAGASMGGPYTLTDQNGRRVSDTAFAGKYRLVYFGYTFCPDVCPTDMQMVGAGLRQFERADAVRAARVVPIFITVDPERDTPDVLRHFVAAFHPRMIGLTGSPAEIDRVAHEYRAFYQHQPPGRTAPIWSITAGWRCSTGRAGSRSRRFRPIRARARRRRAGALGAMRERFWEAPIESLNREEWEALCDGCGKCCLHKLEDDDTGILHATNVACRLLDRTSCRCSNYKLRRAFVPDCVRLDATSLKEIDWLPSTCAYRLRGEGKPLPDWHYLVSGSRESVHEAGMSVRGWTISEDQAGDLEHHLVDRDL